MSDTATTDREKSEAQARVDGLLAVYRENPDTDAVEYYNLWSSSYDKDLDILGYNAPKVNADYFAKHAKQLGLGKDAKIMDLGAGTGISGEKLKDHGFCNLDANDTNQKMLDMAKAKGIYKQFYVGMWQDLPFPEKSYDAVVMVGVGEMNFLSEVIRVIKPGGLLVITMRASSRDRNEQYEKDIDKLGLWECLEEVVLPNQYFPDQDALILAYKIL